MWALRVVHFVRVNVNNTMCIIPKNRETGMHNLGRLVRKKIFFRHSYDTLEWFNYETDRYKCENDLKENLHEFIRCCENSCNPRRIILSNFVWNFGDRLWFADASDYFLPDKFYTIVLLREQLQNILGGLFNEPWNAAEAWNSYCPMAGLACLEDLSHAMRGT